MVLSYYRRSDLENMGTVCVFVFVCVCVYVFVCVVCVFVCVCLMIMWLFKLLTSSVLMRNEAILDLKLHHSAQFSILSDN